MKEFDRMSVDDRRVVSADNLREEAIHQAENWLMAFGALIPADQIENLSIKLAADLAKPAIEAVAAQAEQIATVLALHVPTPVHEFDDKNGVFVYGEDGELVTIHRLCEECAWEETLETLGDCEWSEDLDGNVYWPCPTAQALGVSA